MMGSVQGETPIMICMRPKHPVESNTVHVLN
jgi:hypothetical protein